MIKGYVQTALLRISMRCWEEPKERENLSQEAISEATDFLLTFYGSKKVLIRGTPLWIEASQWLCRLFGVQLGNNNELKVL
jgi:hypothetical protein